MKLNHNSSVDLVIGHHLDRGTSKARDLHNNNNNRTINEESGNEDEVVSTAQVMKANMIKY